MEPTRTGRPKICHFLHDGSGYGGGGTFSLNYFPGYLGEFDVFAVVGSDGNLSERLTERGVRTRTLPMARPWKALLSLPRLVALFRAEKPDAVILHGQWSGLVGAVAARLAGVGTVLYYTQFPMFYTDWDLYRVIRNRIVEEVSCRLSTRVVCPSAANRYQYLLRHFAPDDRFVHIPNGLDPAPLAAPFDRAALRRELGFPEEGAGQAVVSVSRLSDQKRIDWLVRAWKAVEARFPAARLFIVGRGPEEGRLRALARELGLERCVFAGAQPSAFRYFQAADCAVICTSFESLPMVVMEAMFCGCPMAGAASDGVAETIRPGVTGLLFPPADPAATAAAIGEILSDPARARERAAAARAEAEASYRIDTALRNQIAVLREALDETARTKTS